MSGLIDRAERRGLLARGKNPHDGRAVDVYLTPAGHELIQRLFIEGRRTLAPTIGRLRPEQREQLTGLLDTILEPAGSSSAAAADRQVTSGPAGTGTATA